MRLTPRLMPVIIEAIAITTMTPMATPRMVSEARTLLAAMESRARLTPSNRRATVLPIPERFIQPSRR